MKKLTYESPAIEVLSLEMMKETLQAGSFNGTGDNLSDPISLDGDWTDWFLSGMGGLI